MFGMRGSVGKCLPNGKCIEDVLLDIRLFTYILDILSINTRFFDCVLELNLCLL